MNAVPARATSWPLRAFRSIGASLLAAAFAVHAQDDGPRVYQLAPVGLQTFTAFAVRKLGNEGPDPGQTSPGSQTRTDLLVFRYARTLDWNGRQFTPFVIVPTGRLEVTQGEGAGGDSRGLGDAQLGATLGLVDAPALEPGPYASFRPQASVSALARVWFPTGAYDRAQPVNLGAHRYSFQIGLPTTVMAGQSYRDARLTALELLPTLTFYGANDSPFAGNRRTQDPLFSLESHLTHNLTSRIWVSADLLYRNGGASRTDGVDNHDPVHGWSAGASVAVPAAAGTSLIFTSQRVVKRWDAGPDGWFFRTALVFPF